MSVLGVFKAVIYILCILSVICGIIMVLTGLYIWNYTLAIDQSFTPYLWVLGTLVTITAIYGWEALAKDDNFMQNAYAVALLVLGIIQIVIGATFLAKYFHRDELSNDVKNLLAEMYDKKLYIVEMVLLHDIHVAYQCCGVEGPHGSDVKVVNSTMIMGSCCKDDHDNYLCPIADSHEKGCLSSVTDMAQYRYLVKGTILMLSGTIQLVSAPLVAVLANYLGYKNAEPSGIE